MKGIFNLAVALAAVTFLPVSLIVGEHRPVAAQSSIVQGQEITYTGNFTNTSVNASGKVELRVVFEPDSKISGYVNFTQGRGVRTLCGAGNFKGVKRDNVLLLRFISNDLDRGCGFDKGLVFTLRMNLSDDGSRVENGQYRINNRQSGIFEAASLVQRTPNDSNFETIPDATLQSSNELASSGNQKFSPISFSPMTSRQLAIVKRALELTKMNDFDVAEIDLNNDGRKELLLKAKFDGGYCGVSGDCSDRILENKGGKWQEVMYHSGRGRNLWIGSNVVNGYREISSNYKGTLNFVYTRKRDSYSLSYIEDGKYRITPSSEVVQVIRQSVVYARPSPDSAVSGSQAVSPDGRDAIKPVFGKVGNWFLVQPCDSGNCRGELYYLPANVVRVVR